MKYALSLFAVILMAPSFGAEFRGVSRGKLLADSNSPLMSGDVMAIGSGQVDFTDSSDGANGFNWLQKAQERQLPEGVDVGSRDGTTPSEDTDLMDDYHDVEASVSTRQAIHLLTPEFFSPEAMLWREGEAYRIQDLLADVYGLDRQLAGWRLTSATAITFDGQVIAGEGIAPDGQQAAWVAVLRVPEPSALVLLALGALLVIGVPICRLDATA